MIKEDLHLHTSLSSCASRTAAAADYIEMAKTLNLSLIAFTDHMWDSRVPGASPWYIPQNYEHILKLKDELPTNSSSPRILFGCECECDQNGTVGISRETASELDILLVPNSHTHMRDFVMPSEFGETPQKHANYMVRHFMNIINSPVSEYITAIPHPFWAVCADNHEEIMNCISDRALIDCFTSARDAGIAMEINTSGFEEMTPEHLAVCAYIRMFILARECGCKFTIGSDSHEVRFMSTLRFADDIMNICGISEDNLLILR